MHASRDYSTRCSSPCPPMVHVPAYGPAQDTLYLCCYTLLCPFDPALAPFTRIDLCVFWDNELFNMVNVSRVNDFFDVTANNRRLVIVGIHFSTWFGRLSLPAGC